MQGHNFHPTIGGLYSKLRCRLLKTPSRTAEGVDGVGGREPYIAGDPGKRRKKAPSVGSAQNSAFKGY